MGGWRLEGSPGPQPLAPCAQSWLVPLPGFCTCSFLCRKCPLLRRHKRRGFDPLIGKIPWSRKWQPTPVFLSGKSHGQRSLQGYRPWSHEEPDTAECAHTKHDCLSTLSAQRIPADFPGQMSPLLGEISGFTQLESILTFHVLEK